MLLLVYNILKMEPKVKIYAIVITLSFFVSAALIAEVPNIFKNVLAQQLEDSQEGSSNEDIDRIPFISI